MTTYNAPSWHHKSDRDEFGNDTGIHFSFDSKVANRMTETAPKISGKTGIKSKTKKQHNQEIYKKAYEINQKTPMEYADLQKKMLEEYVEDEFKKNILENIKPDSFGKSFKRYEKTLVTSN
jgi:hypothetical protein